MDFVSRTLGTDAMPGRVFPEASDGFVRVVFRNLGVSFVMFFRFLNCRGLVAVGEVCCEMARFRILLVLTVLTTKL